MITFGHRVTPLPWCRIHPLQQRLLRVFWYSTTVDLLILLEALFWLYERYSHYQ